MLHYSVWFISMLTLHLLCLQAVSQQAPNAASVVVPSSVSLSSKVSLLTTNNENEGVSIRSDEVTGKSSTDGSATSAAGKSSNLSLDALAKAKKALQLKKELSEKLKKLPMVRNHSSSQSLAPIFLLYLLKCSKFFFLFLHSLITNLVMLALIHKFLRKKIPKLLYAL